MRGAPLDAGGHLDRDDQIATPQCVVALRRVTGQAMKVGKWDGAVSGYPAHNHNRVERRQRHGEIGGIGGNATLGPAEDRVVAIETVKRRAAGVGPALVARNVVLVSEIGAAGTL